MADVVTPQEDVSATNIAVPWWHAGCSVLPIKWDGTKSPVFGWREYQRTAANLGQVRTWFEQRYPQAGVAVICGAVSGNLEMLELEGRAYNSETLAQITAACIAIDHTEVIHAGVTDLWERLLRDGYTEITPSGGLHILYRITDHEVPGNEKIASRPANEDEYTEQEKEIRERQSYWSPTRVLAETRGEGGYVIVAPTSGRSHPSGEPWRTLTGTPHTILQITWEQRQLLHTAIRDALHVPQPQENLPAVVSASTPPRPVGAPLSIAEDFNTRGSWLDDWFTDQGWRIHHREGLEIFWTRPGKDHVDGHSATTGMRQGEADCLYVWSTSTSLPAERPLTKFQVFSHYRFGGNMTNAAKFLAHHGYGTPSAPAAEFQNLDLGDEVVVPEGVIEQQGWERDDERDARYQLALLETDLSGGIILTDSGYALRMRDKFRHSFRYNSQEKVWYVWTPAMGVWVRDEYSRVDVTAHKTAQETFDKVKELASANVGSDKEKPSQKLLKEAQQAMDNKKLQAVVARFRTLSPIAATSDSFDSRSDLLNVGNGTLDLVSFDLRAHDPYDLLTLNCQANYDPEAACPYFVKYIHDAMPNEEIRSYVQRAVGYSLLGNPVERAMFLLHGPSGTGKSVFTDTMTYVFGGYGVTAPSSTFKLKKQEGGTFDLHRLKGKRFITTSEMPEGAQLDEELVKRFTGGDVIPSRGLYEKYVDWRPQGVVWIATNFLPRLNGDDNAIWRRVRTIPMNNEVVEEIKGLSRQLQQESDGILNWALEGLREYRRIGLAEPESIILDIADYRTTTDSVSSWLAYSLEDGQLVLDPEAKIPLMTLYSMYVSGCQDAGLTHLGKIRFSKRINSVHTNVRLEKAHGRTNVAGVRVAQPGSTKSI